MLKQGTDPSRTGSRAADKKAVGFLSQRGLDKAERTRLRGLIDVALGPTAPLPEVPAGTSTAQERRREALVRLRDWFEEWSTTARAVVKKRGYLIRLGLANRKSPQPRSPAPSAQLLFPEGIPFTQRPSAETSGPPTAREIIAAWRLKDEWGFHQSLSGDELDAYADAVLAAAAGEGVLARSERDWIIGYFATIGMPEARVETLRDVKVSALAPDLVRRLGTYRDTPAGRLSCRALVYDCIRAAGADSEYHVEESARVHHLACMLDIDEQVTRDRGDLPRRAGDEGEAHRALLPRGTTFMA